MANKILGAILALILIYAFWMKEFTVPKLEMERDLFKEKYSRSMEALQSALDNPVVHKETTYVEIERVVYIDTNKVTFWRPKDNETIFESNFGDSLLSGKIKTRVYGLNIKLLAQGFSYDLRYPVYKESSTITVVQRVEVPQPYPVPQEPKWRFGIGGDVGYLYNSKQITFAPKLLAITPRGSSYYLTWDPFLGRASLGYTMGLNF